MRQPVCLPLDHHRSDCKKPREHDGFQDKYVVKQLLTWERRKNENWRQESCHALRVGRGRVLNIQFPLQLQTGMRNELSLKGQKNIRKS